MHRDLGIIQPTIVSGWPMGIDSKHISASIGTELPTIAWMGFTINQIYALPVHRTGLLEIISRIRLSHE